MDDEKKYAVLIDSDNVSPKYIRSVLEEVSNFGVATYKRIYGDWTKNNGWKDSLLDNSILPVQQYSYTQGKNATDSAMIIDAMDILYSGNVEGFCLVSSDSDFTRLAARLREDGKHVIGMGERKTPNAFRRACNVFKILEVISGEKNDSDSGSDNKSDAVTSVADIRTAVSRIIMENTDKGKETQIGEVGSKLNLIYPDFDVRNYGYSKLTTFLKDSCPDIRFTIKHNQVVLSLDDYEGDIISLVHDILRSNGGAVDNLSRLHDDIRKLVPDFNVNNYGYNKFGKFARSLPGVEAAGDNGLKLKE